MQAAKDEGRAVQAKVHYEQRPRSEKQANVPGGIRSHSIMVKAQGVRGGDGMKGFLTFTKDPNYAYSVS